MKSSKWLNSAERRRIHAKFRAKLCAMLNCPIDSCFTTGELLRDARLQRDFGIKPCVWLYQAV